VPERPQQPRTLGVFSALALVSGSMLGIGIFIAPPVVAAQVDRPVAFLLMWLLGGLSALFGALSIAELGAMMPEAGGDYIYLRRAYGPGLAYAAGWVQLLAIFPGSLAVMAVGTAKFQLATLLGPVYGWPATLGLPGDLVWAASIVVVITLLNHVGVALSGRVQVLTTVIPLAILSGASAIILIGRGASGGAWGDVAHVDANAGGATSLALAFLPIYFAYSGWNSASYVAGEIRDPARNLPIALIFGTLGIMVLYLVLCVGFLTVFSMTELAGLGEVGTATARSVFGHTGEVIMTGLIAFAMLGSINGTVLTGSRIAFAMAQKGHCIAAAGRLHPQFGTPVVALWLQAIWTLVLIGAQTFEQLVSYASAAMLLSGALTVMAVVVLRWINPELPRPYRTFGYPITPVAYAATSFGALALLVLRGLQGGGAESMSVLLAVGWFAGAWLLHRFVTGPRRSAIAPTIDARSAGSGFG